MEREKQEVVNMDVWKMEALLNACYGVGFREKKSCKEKTNGELLQEIKDEIINDWVDYKKNCENDRQSYISEKADSYTEIYTSEVYNWYAQDCHLDYYADDALKEMRGEDIIKILQYGMYLFLQECFNEFLDEAGEED